MQLSVTIITKNEEANIRRCLDSVRFAHEIVVLDSGSGDDTVRICEDFGCRVFSVPWQGFGLTKQAAVDAASCDWVLSVDADEELSSDLQNRLKTMDAPKAVHGFTIQRKTFYLGRPIRFSGWGSDAPLRLFRKSKGGFTRDIVHEKVVVTGKTGIMKECMYHYSYPTVSSHLKKIDHYTTLGAEKLAEKGKNAGPVTAVFRGLFKSFQMYILKLGLLDGKEGFTLAMISGFGVYIKYIKLWEYLRAGSPGGTE